MNRIRKWLAAAGVIAASAAFMPSGEAVLASDPSFCIKCATWELVPATNPPTYKHEFYNSNGDFRKCDGTGCHTTDEPGSCSSEHVACDGTEVPEGEFDNAALGDVVDALAVGDASVLDRWLGTTDRISVNWERGVVQFLDCKLDHVAAQAPLTQAITDVLGAHGVALSN